MLGFPALVPHRAGAVSDAHATPSPIGTALLTASNVTLQFGAKPLFENDLRQVRRRQSLRLDRRQRQRQVDVHENPRGRPRAREPGNVSLDPGERLGKLSQDQFAYEDLRVLDVVMMGHAELWNVLKQRDAIYADPDATDADYLRAAELEANVAELPEMATPAEDARAGELAARR